MYFYKIHHPSNFLFARNANVRSGALQCGGEDYTLKTTELGSDVYRLTVEHERWRDNGSQAEFAEALPGANTHALTLKADGSVALIERDSGKVRLAGIPRATFGVCGTSWMFQFLHDSRMEFYGLGEHNKGLEKSGQRVKFWNTDLFGDFPYHECIHGNPNPMYVSVPWVIVRRNSHYIGILVNNPGAVFMDLASDFVWDGQGAEDHARDSFYVGAPDGKPELYILAGPSLPQLIRKLQTLVGRTPRPPLWALGHNQCRWGYTGPADLWALDRRFTESQIPCDGLWLDIDYMDRYKVFTFSRKHWRGEKGIRTHLKKLAERGRRVVPILDPGVKVQKGYSVYESGVANKVFCLNPAGTPFVGYVWPGQTHFPDFSLAHVRTWWAGYVKKLGELGIAGVWLDMNDPSIGAVELSEMLFDQGRKPHSSYHNQYALGMARATREGFLAASPDRRPFLVSRSAYISSSRYAAVWTGDNVSNWHHLRLSISVSVGLAMSGIPFNGGDVAGFYYSTTPELMIAWYKAAFLLPFFRNHTARHTKRQEPWACGARARQIVGHYIRLRYKLLPYLYQLFIEQERTGEAILRPLFYGYDDSRKQKLGKVGDQFFVGPCILQAPIVEEAKVSRSVILPGVGLWFSTSNGKWLRGERKYSVRATAIETPLFIREGSIIPMQVGERTTNDNDLTKIELHCFLRRSTAGRQRVSYVCDDGESFAYQRGVSSRFDLEFHTEGQSLIAEFSTVDFSYKPIQVCVVAYDSFEQVVLRSGSTAEEKTLRTTASSWQFSGRPLQVWKTGFLAVPYDCAGTPAR